MNLDTEATLLMLVLLNSEKRQKKAKIFVNK